MVRRSARSQQCFRYVASCTHVARHMDVTRTRPRSAAGNDRSPPVWLPQLETRIRRRKPSQPYQHCRTRRPRASAPSTAASRCSRAARHARGSHVSLPRDRRRRLAAVAPGASAPGGRRPASRCLVPGCRLLPHQYQRRPRRQCVWCTGHPEAGGRARQHGWSSVLVDDVGLLSVPGRLLACVCVCVCLRSSARCVSRVRSG